VIRRAAAALLALAMAPAAAAGGDWPRVREIVFTGNDTTQAGVLLREMVVRVGDPADPELLERSRQAIQDLRLFSAVELGQEPVADGVRVRVTVAEKYYLLPLPRASLNSDGQYSYGVGLRWSNLLGMNHTLHLTVAQGDRQAAGRGSMVRLHGSYEAPFVFESRYGLGLEFTHIEEPSTQGLFAEEVTDGARALLWRAWTDGGPASRGWRLGAGAQWDRQQRFGVAPVASPGQATALVLRADYDDMRFNLHSEEGLRFDVEGRAAVRGLGSDYDYDEALASYEHSWRVGARPHQTLGVFLEGAAYGGGPAGVPPRFMLGGADNLRGYELNFLGGERYWYGGVEFLRPLRWDWLRGMVFAEAGDAFGGAGPDGTFADVGVGLRLRLDSFVRTEFSIGIAYPLVDPGDGRSVRFFASGHR
jgi:outer membrane protein assembly factor BamA